MREADNLTTFMCRMSRESGSLNLLDRSGSYGACYGTPLPLPSVTTKLLFTRDFRFVKILQRIFEIGYEFRDIFHVNEYNFNFMFFRPCIIV